MSDNKEEPTKVNVSSLKGTRTRYRNTIEKEISIGNTLLRNGPDVFESREFLGQINKCVKRLRLYMDKLENTTERLSAIVNDEEWIERIREEDEVLYSDSFDCCVSLEHYEETLKNVKPTSDASNRIVEEKTEPSQTELILQLMSQMQELMLMQQQDKREHNRTTSVKLPKLDLPTFNGDKLLWSEFWDAYECTIHENRKLSNVEKFNYLQSKLSGDAKAAISGLTLTNDNYLVAVSLLKDRFGDSQAIIDLHYSKLMCLPPAIDNTESLWNLLDSIEKHLRSLEAMGQNTDQNVFVSMITSKLPNKVLMQLELMKGVRTRWTVAKLREVLSDYIHARERSEEHSKEEVSHELTNRSGQQPRRETNYKSQNMTTKGITKTDNASPMTSAEALTTGTRQVTTRSNTCRYCEGNHWSDECKKYTTIEDRKMKIKGSCYICLKQGHISKECRLNKICVYCGKNNSHHRSLCPKRIPMKLTESVHFIEETENTDLCPTENVLISSHEMVVMQTALTEVQNPECDNSKEIRIMLDSGSQRTYISESLANYLQLKRGPVQEISLITFGSDKPKIIRTPTTKVDLKLKDGTFLEVTANIVPNITGTIQRRAFQLPDSTKCLIRDLTLADTIPRERESSEIDLLIGNDYYLDIILPQKMEIQPGLYLLDSKFGWILTGRTTEKESESSEQSMLILTNRTKLNTNDKTITNVDSVDPRKPDLNVWNVDPIDKVNSCGVKEFNRFSDTMLFKEGRYGDLGRKKFQSCQEIMNSTKNKTVDSRR